MNYKKSNYTIIIPHKGSCGFFNTMSGGFIILDEDCKRRYEEETLSEEEIKILAQNGFLIDPSVDERNLIDQARNIAVNKRKPYYRILPTTACNAECEYCFEKGYPVKNMDAHTMKATVDFINRTTEEGDTVKIIWFGGEPFLQKNVTRLLHNSLKNLFDRKNITGEYQVITNGSLIDKDFAKEMKDLLEISVCQITLDGYGAAYDEIKRYKDGKSYFATVMDNIGFLLDNKIKVSVRMNYNKHNYDGIVRLIEEFHNRFGTDKNLSLHLAPVWAVGINYGEMNYSSTGKAEEGFLSLLQLMAKYGYTNPQKLISVRLNNSVCAAKNIGGFSIMPDGVIVKCCDCAKSTVGTVFGDSLKSDIMNDWATTKIEEKCIDCKLLPMCQGGCQTALHTKNARCKITYDELVKVISLYMEHYIP
ncbi:MAG: radical SAM protein [Lachnospiraceae bacterium]|nr:radical SAM protein [Lachnospiraceae bacterium]